MLNPRFTVERNGKFTTIRSACRTQAAVDVYPDARPISWVETKEKTVVNGCITVTDVY